jgi:DegV family protein with EDD domain
MAIRIVTDSTCDLPPETIARYGIRVVPLYVNVDSTSYLDGVDLTREEFYKKLPYFPRHPTTAAPSPPKFHAIYDDLAEQGADQVLSIHISSALSAVLDVAHIAASETTSTRVTVFDSRQLSLGTGFLVETAARMASGGCTMDEILAALNDQIQSSHVFAVLDTLEFLRRSGRMNGIISNLGTLLQIKPILTMFDGRPGTERVRTRDRALKRILELLAGMGELERIAIVHAQAHENVAELRRRAANFLPGGPILTQNITPVIGVHVGPGAFGFAVVRAA